MDGTLEDGCSRLDLNKQATTKFRLAPGEELVVCPYDMAHIVTNHRMTVHIVKCRRNYDRAMKANDELVQMVSCKYNWAHQIPVPELVYHEMTCVDRLTLITHILEFSEPDSRNPDKLNQVTREVYVTKGVPFMEFRPTHHKIIPEDSVVSKHLMPRKMVSIRQKEDFGTLRLRLRSAPKASHVNVRSIVSTGSKSSAPPATFYPPGEKGPNYRNARSGGTSVIGMDGSSSIASYQDAMSTIPSHFHPRPQRDDPDVNNYYFDGQEDEGEDKSKYEWELDPPLRPYNPLKKFETEMLLKYPANMSKSERKAWKNANVAKVKELYGGQLIHMAPAQPPPGVPRNTGDGGNW